MGYGDVTPKQSVGRFIATVVMLTGIGFLAVVTASVTASLVESSRRRFTAESEADATRQFDWDRATDWRGSKRHSSSSRPGGHPMEPADEPGSITGETSEEQAQVAPPAPREEQAPQGRIRRFFSRSREMWRVVYRDPEHVAERLTLYTAGRLGDLVAGMG